MNLTLSCGGVGMVWLVMWSQRVSDPGGRDAIDENVGRTGNDRRGVKSIVVGSYIPDLGCMLRHNTTQLMRLHGGMLSCSKHTEVAQK